MLFGQMSIGSGKEEEPEKIFLSVAFKLREVSKGSPLCLLGRVPCAKNTLPEMNQIV